MTAILNPITSTLALRSTLQEQLNDATSKCIQCQRCVKECRFLKSCGDPKDIADSYNPGERHFLDLPFKCSLCGLCTAVCSEGIDPAQMLLEMRRETFDRGEGDFPEHGGLR